MFNKSPLKSTRVVKRRRRKVILVTIFSILLIAGIIALVSWFSKKPSFQINEIQVTGDVTVDADAIKNIAQNEIVGNYMWLFQKANRFLYPADKIEKEILSKDIIVQSLKFNISQNILTINVLERVPAYLWCNEKIIENQKCYFLDETGLVFTQAPSFSEGTYFTFYKKTGENIVGTRYLEQAKFEDLKGFIKKIRSFGIDIVSLEERAEASELSIKTGGRILFNSAGDLNKTADNIKEVSDKTSIFTSPDSKLEYADFRYGNKIYYK